MATSEVCWYEINFFLLFVFIFSLYFIILFHNIISASQACRGFLNLSPPSGGLDRPAYFKTLLPALFVSRRDPAEGVRTQALVNWRRAVNQVYYLFPINSYLLISKYIIRTEKFFFQNI